MGKGRIALVLIVIVIIVVIAFASFVPLAIRGYSGLESRFNDIEIKDYEKTLVIEDTSFTFDPGGLDIADPILPCGIKGELGQPNVVSTRPDFYDKIEHIDEEAGINRTQVWESHIVTCIFTVEVHTHEGGLDPLYDTVIWIELEETATSVFQTADESEAFIIEVWTDEKTDELYPTIVDISPDAGGKTLEIFELESTPVPQWILDSGYTEALQIFKRVRFRLDIHSMQPASWKTGSLGRYENQVTWHLACDVLLFGYWEVIAQYHEWESGEEKPLGLDDLIAFIVTMMWFIVGIIGSVLILWKAPGYWKVVGLAVIWLVIGWQLGWLDPLFDMVRGFI